MKSAKPPHKGYPPQKKLIGFARISRPILGTDGGQLHPQAPHVATLMTALPFKIVLSIGTHKLNNYQQII